MLFSQAAFNLRFLQPDSNQQTFVFAGLSAVIFLLFVALTFVLIRNLLKLYAETRSGVLGSRFRTKMVIGALLLSLTPTVFLFLFAYSLMNRSIDKWFSRPVEELRAGFGVARRTCCRNMRSTNASRRGAGDCGGARDAARVCQQQLTLRWSTEMRRHEATLQGGFAVALLRRRSSRLPITLPEPWGELRQHMRTHPHSSMAAGATMHTIQTADGREFFFSQARGGSARRGDRGHAHPSPVFRPSLRRSRRASSAITIWGASRKQVRQFYMMLLSVITAAVLFASTWLSLFISRLVARPVAALAEATQEISRGNLDYRVDYRGSDELGQLVDRFNHMADELESGRSEILESRADLEQANLALEQRRRQIETILESIPTGVISRECAGAGDARQSRLHGHVSRTAASVCARTTCCARPLSRRSSPEITRLMRKADRMGSAGAQLEIQRRGPRPWTSPSPPPRST